MNIKEVLLRYWGFTDFRHPQEEIIQAVMAGQDVFAMLPTGGGKSLCYQVPALLFDGVTIVVSPLIALIEDQVRQLTGRGIPVGYLHSGMDRVTASNTMDSLLSGAYKLFYVSPERLQNELFLEQTESLNIDFLAIDEAHCISQWGHDFRPSYRAINEFKKLYPDIVTLAVTASATSVVKKDIMAQLNLKAPKIFELSVIRPNLSYHVQYEESKVPELAHILAQNSGTAIAYCGTRRKTTEAAAELSQLLPVPVFSYHAGLHKKEKDFAYRQWSTQENAIICATSAFGMGIDKADVRTVFHLDLPTSLEQYYQEVGRAGRDQAPARGILLFHNGDLNRLMRLPDLQYPPLEKIYEVYEKLMNYLQVGLGEGAGWAKAFDLVNFTQKFELPVLETISALRILEQEGFLIWSEDARTKYTARFTTTRTNLEYLEKNFKKLYEVAEVLLRHYGSVFYFETAIQIFDLSKELRIDKSEFEDRLYRLQDMGILEYTPAIVGSFMVLLEKRLALPYLNINKQALKMRKAEFIAKIQALIAFVEDGVHCRNQLLSKYFGQGDAAAPCGHCDNCLKHSLKAVPGSVTLQILSLLQQEKELPVVAIIETFAHYPRHNILKLLQELISERKLFLKGDVIYI
ncbi:MAG: hypothetical protein BGO31_11335 [Bacteroidetes bacterium 43-16]|nr:MAG: hypothetical protein BGO31_11335 [Bacteroidetes bacterium 43-16]